MIIESGLAQTTQFSESLDIKLSPAQEKTEDELTLEAKIPEQSSGDTVTISEAARALAAAENSGETGSGTEDGQADATGSEKGQEGAAAKAMNAGSASEAEDEDLTDDEQQIQRLKEMIEKLEEEIKEIEGNDELSEKQKIQQIQGKQTMLMELREQLADALKEQAKNIGASPYGGTRAEGFGGSVSTF